MRKRVLFVLLSMSLSVALTVGGHADTLQEWFDSHGYDINAATDELGIEKFVPGSCVVTVLNGVHAYLNPVGWYSSEGNKPLLFGGVADVGATDSFVAGEEFGLYIDSDMGTFHTETALNQDRVDHARVFESNLEPGYIVAFEDMLGGGDLDYTDRIILATIAPLGPWYVDCSVSVSRDGRSWPTAFKTIQEGINAAEEGDEIIVAPCIYRENIVFKGRNIFLHSIDPDNPQIVASTIIDGGQEAAVVTFEGSENAECLFLGFTVRNGSAGYGGGICGGTQDRRTHATIRNCMIVDNQAAYNGGGVAFCDGLIENNLISENEAEDRGGGLHDCQGTVQNNTITGNTASYSGGGVHWSHGLIQNNTVHGNSAGRGGGLDECGGIIQYNTIVGNSVDLGGGGLAWCEGTIQGNVIRENYAFYGGGLAWGQGTIQSNLVVGNVGVDRGGGLERCDGPIRNNTIVANSASDRGGGLADCRGAIINCIIWGNMASRSAQLSACTLPTYSCILEWTGGEGNFSQNPGFVDADGPDNDPQTYEDNDYHLIESSPGIDVGKNEGWMRQAADMDRNARIWFGISSTTVDVGAYEYGSSRFRILGIIKTGRGIELAWKSSPGDNYIIWSCDDLVNGVWVREMAKELPSSGELTTWIDRTSAPKCKFYKIEMK